MATKLKNLKVTKIDFVDQGANPDAHIMLYKNKNGVPGAEPKVPEAEEKGNVWKRLFGAIAKMAGMKPEELDSAVEQIEKSGSETFAAKMAQKKKQKIVDEMWDICFALHSSLCSIMRDEELDSASASASMMESLDEFYSVAKDSVSKWSNGNITGISKSDEEITADSLEIMKTAQSRLSEAIKKATVAPKKEEPENKEDQKGEDEMSKIDKSKLTDAERAFLEDIEKRYKVKESAPAEKPQKEEKEKEEKEEKEKEKEEKDDAVTKALQALGLGTLVQPEESEDIYKGLHPTLKAELESLRKFRQDTEEKELREVAKSYEIIGKKEEELYPVLKSIKAAGGDAYNQLIAALDGAKNAVEKSGVFTEIGKSGYRLLATPAVNENSAEAKISAIAKGYVEKDPTMSHADAIAKAWEDNPELMAAYEEEAGF